MKALRNTAWTVFAVSALGAFLILSMRYYDHFVLFSMLETYWLFVLVTIAMLMLILLLVRRFVLVRRNGKRGALPMTGAVLTALFALPWAFFAATPMHSPYRVEETEYVSPDGSHMLTRRGHSDWFGNQCYIYGMQGSGRNYQDLFDDDRENLPDLTWSETGVIFRGNEYPFPD